MRTAPRWLLVGVVAAIATTGACNSKGSSPLIPHASGTTTGPVIVPTSTGSAGPTDSSSASGFPTESGAPSGSVEPTASGSSTPSAGPSSGRVLFADSFTTKSGGWPESSDADITLSYNRGAYLLQAHKQVTETVRADGPNLRPQSSLTNVAVQVDTSVSRGTKDDYLGVFCMKNNNEYYQLLYLPMQKQFFLFKRTFDARSGGSSKNLASPSEGISAPSGTGVNNRLRLECTTRSDGVHLRGFINDVQVADDVDFQPFATHGGYVGIKLSSDKGSTDVAFDNFQAEALS
jgi:hypothetical protein